MAQSRPMRARGCLLVVAWHQPRSSSSDAERGETIERRPVWSFLPFDNQRRRALCRGSRPAVQDCWRTRDLCYRTARPRLSRHHSAAQHPLVSLRGYEIAGRALLGAYYWNTFSRLGGESSALVEIIAKADPMVFCCVARRVICQCPDKIALIAEQIVHP